MLMKRCADATQFVGLFALRSAISHWPLQADTYVNRRFTTPTNYVIEPKVVSGRETWSASGSPYIVEGYDWLIDVPAGASLSIEAGVLVYFPSSRDGSGINVGGELQILGSTQSPVRLIRDPSQDSGTWSGIRFNTNSAGLLQNAVLDDSGHEPSGWQAGHPGAAIYIYGSSPTIHNVTINRSGGRGIRVEGPASPQIEGCQIVQSLREAILWQNFTGGSPRFQGNSGSNSGMNAIYVGNGELTTDMVFQTNSIPYYLQGWDGNLTIGTNATLTIDENVILKCSYGRDGGAIDVRGRLIANGSASTPILMTCAEDDAVAGDTDGSTNAPVAGNWSGIRIMEGGQGNLHHVALRYAGHVSSGWQAWHPAASVYSRNAQATLDHCTIEFSQAAGLRINRANVTMTESEILGGGGNAVDIENGGLAGLYDFTGTTASSNAINGIVMRGELAGDLQLGNYAMPYVVAGWVTVPATNVLSFAPGSRVMFVVAGDRRCHAR
jgi:hypothetical protein